MSKYQYSGRTEQRKAALKRSIDARRLQEQARWRGAMYLAGYSIECRLKAVLLEMYGLDHLDQLETEIERRAGRPVNIFTHSIEILFDLTGGRQRLLNSVNSREIVLAYHRCNTWKPSWRYRPDDGSKADCDSFLEAVSTFSRFIDSSV